MIRGKTGHRSEPSGIDRSTCSCGDEIALSVGETFPPGRTVHGAGQWTLVRPTHK